MKTKGFTLVELLVVIAILAILATVSVVGYTTYINNANQSKAVQELTQIRDYAMAYDLGNAAGNKDGEINETEATAAITASGISAAKYESGIVNYYAEDNTTILAHWDVDTGKVVAGAHTTNE